MLRLEAYLVHVDSVVFTDICHIAHVAARLPGRMHREADKSGTVEYVRCVLLGHVSVTCSGGRRHIQEGPGSHVLVFGTGNCYYIGVRRPFNGPAENKRFPFGKCSDADGGEINEAVCGSQLDVSGVVVFTVCDHG